MQGGVHMTVLGLSDFLKKELKEEGTAEFINIPDSEIFNLGLVVGDNAWRERINIAIKVAEALMTKYVMFRADAMRADHQEDIDMAEERMAQTERVIEALRGLIQ